MSVDTDQGFCSLDSFRGLLTSNKHTIRCHEIRNCCTFGQKLGVTQDLELISLVVGLEDTLDGLSCADGHGGLFDDNFVTLGNLQCDERKARSF